MEHIIDAKGRTIGRIATEVASILAGKNSTSYAKNVLVGEKVQIVNASKIKIDAKKMTTVFHEKYSGYPGGLKHESIAKIVDKKGYGEILKLAVHGMLPRNKLKDKAMKNLKISE